MPHTESLASMRNRFSTFERLADYATRLSPRRYHHITPALMLLGFRVGILIVPLMKLIRSASFQQSSLEEQQSVHYLLDRVIQLVHRIGRRHHKLRGSDGPYIPSIRGVGSFIWIRMSVAAEIIVNSYPLSRIDPDVELPPGPMTNSENKCPICLDHFTSPRRVVNLPCHPLHQIHLNCMIVSHIIPTIIQTRSLQFLGTNFVDTN